MKKNIMLLIIALAMLSCTEVVNIPLENNEPNLVIEALIDWQKGTTGNIQKIKLTTTADFYTNQIPVVNGANVTIKNEANTLFNFIEIDNTGEYVCTNFEPVLNKTYHLTIISNGNTYTATETLKSVAPIINVTQETVNFFGGDTKTIKAFYNDPEATQDYYSYKYVVKYEPKPSLYVAEDKFYNGNPYFSVAFDDNIIVGDTVKITHYGISKQYYDYLNILISVAGSPGGGPFQAPPVSVRGNISNTTNPSKFPLGFFRLSEIDHRDYIVE
jgi:hypothetical protein